MSGGCVNLEVIRVKEVMIMLMSEIQRVLLILIRVITRFTFKGVERLFETQWYKTALKMKQEWLRGIIYQMMR